MVGFEIRLEAAVDDFRRGGRLSDGSRIASPAAGSTRSTVNGPAKWIVVTTCFQKVTEQLKDSVFKSVVVSTMAVAIG